MPFIKYKPVEDKSPTSSNIRGMYNQKPDDLDNVIEIDQRESELWKRDPNGYAVVDSKLVAIKRPYSNLNKVGSVSEQRKQTRISNNEPLEVKDRTYHIDQAFQNNLSLALGIVACDPKHKIKLWCKIDEEWQFKEHSRNEILEVAYALNDRRENNSDKLYNK